MDYVCIKCRKTWRKGEPSDEVSGGLCDECIIRYVRDKQKSQGHHDCFRRATEICSRKDCTYYDLCIRPLLD